MTSPADLTPAELKTELDAGRVTLIDVREPVEHEEQAIPGARLIPMHDILSGAVELPREEPIVLHCKSGFRSGNVVEALSTAGYDNVRNLTGGIDAWAQAGLPTRP